MVIIKNNSNSIYSKLDKNDTGQNVKPQKLKSKI